MALKLTLNAEAKVFAHYMGAQIKQPPIYISEEVYVTIDSLKGDKDKIHFTAKYLLSDGQSWSKEFMFKPDMSNENFIAQSYGFLKTLDEFKEAVDA